MARNASLFAAAFLGLVTPIIVYPSDGAHLPYFKRTFIFGSAAPGSRVIVNGTQAFADASGGWIAFVPLTPGAFRFHVIASKNGDRSSADRAIFVAAPPRTTPPTPATIDASVAAAPWVDMTLLPRDTLALFVKASVGARVSASLDGGPTVDLRAIPVSQLKPSESKRVLRGALASEVTVDGLYRGELRIPAAARGMMHVHYLVVASNGSTAHTDSKAAIEVVAPGWHRVGYIVPGDRNKDIDARPFGVIAGEPDGDWLFSAPAQTVFNVTGAAGDYYRVALSSDQAGWILKSSLRLSPSGTPLSKASVRDIELFDQERWGVISIRVTDKVPFWVEELPERPGLRLHLYDMSESADLSRDGAARSNVAAARLRARSDGTAAVDITLRQRTLWGYRAQWSGDDLQISVKAPPSPVEAPASALTGLTIVIDPGHSPDPGSIGPLGTQERDINLEIAKRLATRLEMLGARAVLTRTSDVPVGLYDRPAFAAQQNADILISVHNNALPDGSNPFVHHGYSVYYFRPQSLGLARAIHDSYARIVKLRDDGLYKEELALTRATEEPAVLTESAFVMWPPEEMDLRDPAFLDKCAQAIADGVAGWVSSVRALPTP